MHKPFPDRQRWCVHDSDIRHFYTWQDAMDYANRRVYSKRLLEARRVNLNAARAVSFLAVIAILSYLLGGWLV